MDSKFKYLYCAIVTEKKKNEYVSHPSQKYTKFLKKKTFYKTFFFWNSSNIQSSELFPLPAGSACVSVYFFLLLKPSKVQRNSIIFAG